MVKKWSVDSLQSSALETGDWHTVGKVDDSVAQMFPRTRGFLLCLLNLFIHHIILYANENVVGRDICKESFSLVLSQI